MAGGNGSRSWQAIQLRYYPRGISLSLLAPSQRSAHAETIPNVALFEAFYNYCFVPKHTIGSQLLTVRRDKRERAAYEASQMEDGEFDDDNEE